ncbi:hypothetical protein BKA65DRAFT_432909 [Rhexocercosporidium sp. MPI-PUGE-AT-0058]|nr:hypothetical protein BKA65DRAFT_432909 [Rhexocercosporidium sp. MPI-PUGE-AT-0058]
MAWRSWKLHWVTLAILTLLEIGILVALGVLHHLSDKNQGFTSIKQNVVINASAGNHNLDSIWNIGFLWTSLPSLIMILFGLAWAAVVDSLAEETPMRELVRSGGSPMDKTLLLDYRRYMSFVRWFPAFKNHHIFLGFCLLLTTVNNIALLPLAARLFTPVPVALDKPGTFVLQTSYSTSAEIALVDYAPIFATVTAVRLHGGTWPTYTDGTYAYPTFIVPTTANLTQSSLNATGYGADLDCVNVQVYNISRLDDTSGSGTISVSATDRGCDISFKGGVGPGSKTFLKTQSTIDCQQDAGFSRVSYFVGSYAPSASYLLDDLSVVSCKPNYKQTQGTLTAPPSLNPLSFHTQNQFNDARIDNWRGYEQDMLSLSNIGNSDSPDFTSAFGELILGISRQRNPNSPLSPDALIASSAEAFSSVFAVFAKVHLFNALATDENVSGVLTVSETRLMVVTWSAYTSIAILAVLTILTILMIFYLVKHKPVCPEEPCGIAGYASLLYDSNTYHTLLTEANQSPGYDGKFYEWLANSYLLGSERCTLNQANRVIDIQGLAAIQRTGNGLVAEGTGHPR